MGKSDEKFKNRQNISYPPVTFVRKKEKKEKISK